MPSGVYKRKKGIFHHSEETKSKLRLIRATQIMPKEAYEKAKATRAKTAQKDGYYHSPETKKKIGQANKIALKGNKLSQESIEKRTATRRRNGWHKNKKAYLLKISGEKSWSWCGGTSFESYGPDFNKRLKEKIKKRDKYQCKVCGKAITKHGYVHHIDYVKQNNNPDNLILLCNSCHSKANFHRRSWMDILSFFMLCAKSEFDEPWNFVESSS